MSLRSRIFGTEREAVTKPVKTACYICRRFNDCCDEDKDALLLDLDGSGVDLAPGPVADNVPLAHAQRGVALVVQEHLGAVCRGGAGVDVFEEEKYTSIASVAVLLDFSRS